MSTVGSNALTLSDWGRRVEDGKIAKIIEIMNDQNAILDDMMWVQGNLATGHKTTIRSGLPSVTWRLLNYGVQPSKARTVQVTDNCGMLEAYAQVDKSLADLNGNTSEFRLSEDKAFIEAMNQEFASTLFYGNVSTDPEKFMGLAPRFNSSSAENSENVIKGTQSESHNSSIWLIGWGDNTAHGIFPKGSKAGLTHTDKGQVTLEDVAGGLYEGYRSHYKWDCGLTVRDWRSIVRIQTGVTNLVKNAASGSDLIDLLVQAVETVPSLNMGRFVFYANKTVLSYLRRQIANKVASSTLTQETVGGKHVVMFDGIPFKKCDAILNTESSIS